MKRILFVDDEPYVLEGLRRMLRPMRHEWEVAFADSSKAALKLLAESRFDMVVSDMLMPGMSGVELLDEVKTRYPDTIRVVLSGHSDEETILRSVEPAHQYLAKPCDPEQLKSTIARACALRELLTKELLSPVISRVGSLPSAPSLYLELLGELRSAEPSIERVAEIVARDVGMTAKILQLVNSAFFGLHSHVANIQQAVSIIGLKTLKALVLSVQVFSQFQQRKMSGLHIDNLMNHSMETAVFARMIAEMEKQDKEVTNFSFLAGLLHDVGKLVLATGFPDKYADVSRSDDVDRTSTCEAERRVFGSSHGEVGAYLMGLWGIPDVIVEALAFHHNPSACVHRRFSPLTAVHVANAFAHEQDSGVTVTPPSEVDRDYLEMLGLMNRIPVWRMACCNTASAGVSNG